MLPLISEVAEWDVDVDNTLWLKNDTDVAHAVISTELYSPWSTQSVMATNGRCLRNRHIQTSVLHVECDLPVKSTC